MKEGRNGMKKKNEKKYLKKVILKMDTEKCKKKDEKREKTKYSQFYFDIRLNGNTFPRVCVCLCAADGGGELNILNEKH